MRNLGSAFTIVLYLCIVTASVSVPSILAQTAGNGDVNGDGKIDYKDIQKVLQNYGKSITTGTNQYPDSVINNLDANVIYRIISQPLNTNTPVPSSSPSNTPGTTVYYISPGGNDSNSGLSITSPFKTVQKCASVATAGTLCTIRAGTYRETITPANSGTSAQPIVFQPYNGEKVIINGSDIITTSWTIDSGQVYETSPVWSLGVGKNQLFIDGKMTGEAKWPNGVDNPMTVNWSKAQQAMQPDETSAPKKFRIFDTNFQNQSFWSNGGKILTIGATEWFSSVGDVLSAQNGQLEVNITSLSNSLPTSNFVSSKIVPYYLFNSKNALDQNGEWYVDQNTSTLYFRTPTGSTPQNHTVELKRRQFGFDLSNRSSIRVTGIDFFSTSILTNSASSQNILDAISLIYPSHDLNFANTFSYVSGIQMNGSDNTIRNSEIAFGSGAGIYVLGQNNNIINNILHDLNYAAAQTGAINIHGAIGTRVENNTIYNTGRGSIEPAGKASKILHNDLYNSNLLTLDGGLIYTSGDGVGTEIGYNKFHDNKATYLGLGIYIDAGWVGSNSQNYTIHHNLIWNAVYAGIFTKANIGDNPSPPNNYTIYNNNVWNTPRAIISQDISKAGSMNVYNNLTSSTIVEGTVLNNNFVINPSLFPDPAPPSNSVAGAYQNPSGNWSAGADFQPKF